jgi:pilus assembly protein CpaB
VDVLVSSEAGGGRSYLALEDVELLDLRPGDPSAGPDEGGAPASSVATLRVTLRQAVFLTAAENFGREIRLLARPPGDRRRSGGAAVPARSL